MFRSRFLLTAVVAVASALLVPATSQATFTLTVTEIGGPTSGPITGTGAITFTAIPFGDFTIQTTTTTSNSTSNTTPAMMSILNTTVTNQAGGPRTVVITATDDQFNVPTTDLKTVWTSLAGSFLTTGSTVTLKSTLEGTDGTPVSQTGNALNIGAAQQVNDSISSNVSPYHLTLTMTITLQAGGSYSGSGNVNVYPTPAPAGLVMFASALPFFGLLRLRRRSAKPEAATAA